MSPVGNKNTIADTKKKKINVGPNEAAKGKFRILSIETVISMTRLKSDIVFFLSIARAVTFCVCVLDVML